MQFRERYSVAASAGTAAAEKYALGTDYQANGYTTRAQADNLGERLRLRAGQLLVDVGSGCGWPGLYLAEKHHCRVISLDPVPQGCAIAQTRSILDDLTARSMVVCADATAIPVASKSADAVLHTDVMC